jgi:CheY-like chemotaxis protein
MGNSYGAMSVDLRKPVILIVDDDPNDRFLMQTAFSNIGVRDAVYSVADGAEAIEYLEGRGLYADRNRFLFPNLLLLDLKMAKMHGFEFLRYIRKHPHLMVIPTIVFTSSEDMEDIKRAYMLGANSYLIKGKTFEGLCDQFKFIYGYWMRVRVPPIDLLMGGSDGSATGQEGEQG